MISDKKAVGRLQRRRQERTALTLTADLVIQPGDENPACFTGRVFNLSVSGAAFSSNYYFAPGKLLQMELHLPIRGAGVRRLVFYGVIRHARSTEDGNVMGVEFQEGSAADQAGLRQYLAERLRARPSGRPSR